MGQKTIQLNPERYKSQWFSSTDSLRQPNSLIRSKMQHRIVTFNQCWQRLKMAEVCEMISEWNVEKLCINFNSHSNILKEIQLVNFPMLEDLDLSKNRICSVEKLIFLRIPKIKCLWFPKNLIICIKQLKKGRWMSLQTLALHNNNILEGGFLSYLSSPQLKVILIEFAPTDSNQSEDLRWAFKLKTDILRNIYCYSEQRIDPQLLAPELKKKYMSDLIVP